MKNIEILFFEESGSVTNLCIPETEVDFVTDSGITLNVKCSDKNGYMLLTMEAKGTGKGYFSVKYNYDKGVPVVFSGEKENIHEIYRQSPHDPADHVIDMAKEVIPAAGVKDSNEYLVICSDSPYKYNNYTTQEICKEYICVSSGDNGTMPGYQGKGFVPYFHKITPDCSHKFETVIVSCNKDSHTKLINELFMAIDSVWGYNSKSPFKALCFSTNYMLLRVNETGYSDIWVTPGIVYSNKQYTSDAFWQSMIFPPELQQQCYDAVYKERYRYAENALIYIIWCYRIKVEGGTINYELLKDAIEYVDEKSSEGKYFAQNVANNGYTFKSWYDVCAFDHDDVIAYNQGLFVCALMCAERMGVKMKTTVEEAKREFHKLYNEETKCLMFSAKKGGMSVDGLVGDMLARVYIGEGFVDKDIIEQTYKTVVEKASTPYGIKVAADENGEFPPIQFYMSNGYFYASHNDYRLPGYYMWGGSWYLYEMLFHQDAFLAGVEDAEENLIKRNVYEMCTFGTYHEFVDTRTGEAHRENQGWNTAVYALWEKMMRKGIVTARFFEETDKALSQN